MGQSFGNTLCTASVPTYAMCCSKHGQNIHSVVDHDLSLQSPLNLRKLPKGNKVATKGPNRPSDSSVRVYMPQLVVSNIWVYACSQMVSRGRPVYYAGFPSIYCRKAKRFSSLETQWQVYLMLPGHSCLHCPSQTQKGHCQLLILVMPLQEQQVIAQLHSLQTSQPDTQQASNVRHCVHIP